ncbi:MAG: rhomboid family intramembrane serine protease [Cytophagales bacterium]
MSSIFDDIKNSFNKIGSGLNQIILINVIVFVVLVVLNVLLTLTGNKGIYDLISYQFFMPAQFENFIYKPWTLFTYFFTHDTGNFFHILFNMIFLYWFGSLISEFLGSKRLINLYVLGGVAGGLVYLAAYNFIPYFSERAANTVLLGASGSVYAVVIGAAVLIPDYTFFLLFLGPVKIKYIAGFYALLSFAQTVGPNAGGNVAHLGGALMGFIYIWQLKKGNDWGKPVSAIFGFVTSLFKSSPKMKVTYRNPEKKTTSTTIEDVSQAEIDSILDKISKYGYEKLTKEEKQKLFKASQSTHI